MAGMTGFHRSTCEQLARDGSSQEVRALAAAIGKIFEWLDGSFSDRRRIFTELRGIKGQLKTISQRPGNAGHPAAAIERRDF